MAEQTEHMCWSVEPTSYVRTADRRETHFAVYFQRPPVNTDTGSSFSLNVPALIVSNWIGEPQHIAEKIAALLNEHWPEGKGE